MAVVGPGLDGIILPMVESREQLVAFDWLVGALERERGLPPGGIDIIPIIETGKGIANVRTIAASGTRVKRMAFGAGDYTLDMNMEWTLTESELEHARAEMAVASRAAGLEAPIDTVWVHIKDLDGVANSAKRARQLGFQGKMCIYPPQVERVTPRSPRPRRRSPSPGASSRLSSRQNARVPRRSSWTAISSTTRSSTRRNARSTWSAPPNKQHSILPDRGRPAHS